MTGDLTPELERVIRARDFAALHEMLKHWSPPTTASLIETLPVEQQVVAFRLLPRDLAADVFEYLPLDAQERLLKAMATEEDGEDPERDGARRPHRAARRAARGGHAPAAEPAHAAGAVDRGRRCSAIPSAASAGS